MAKAVLVTRPEPGAGETVARVAALGWQPLAAPALVLAPVEGRTPVVPGGVQAVLLTSRAAARALPPTHPAIPVFAVGEATAAEARARGMTRVTAAAGADAAALAALVADALDPAAGPLLLAVGRGYALDLAAALRARGFRVIRRIVYEVRPAPALPAEAHAAVAAGDVTVALFLSPRSAECAISLLRSAGLAPAIPSIEALCNSERVARAAAAAAAPLRWRAVRVAAHPGQQALLDLLGPAPAPAACQPLRASRPPIRRGPPAPPPEQARPRRPLPLPPGPEPEARQQRPSLRHPPRPGPPLPQPPDLGKARPRPQPPCPRQRLPRP